MWGELLFYAREVHRIDREGHEAVLNKWVFWMFRW